MFISRFRKNSFLLLVILIVGISLSLSVVFAAPAYDISYVDITTEVFGNPNQRQLIWANLTGTDLLYQFYVDDDNMTYRYSTDLGMNWSSPIDMFELYYGRYAAFATWDNYMYYILSASGSYDYYVCRGTINETAPSYGEITWGSQVGKDLGTGCQWPTIAISVDYVYVSYVTSAAGYSIAYSRWDHALASDTSTTASGARNLCTSATLVEDDDIFLVSQEVNGRPAAVTGWGGTLQAIAGTVDDVPDRDILAVSDGSDVYAMAFDTDHYDYYKYNGSWTDIGEFFSGYVDAESLGALSLDGTDGTYTNLVLYFFYGDKLFYSTCDFGDTWTTPEEIEDETALGYEVDDITSLEFADQDGVLVCSYRTAYNGTHDRIAITQQPLQYPGMGAGDDPPPVFTAAHMRLSFLIVGFGALFIPLAVLVYERKDGSLSAARIITYLFVMLVGFMLIIASGGT